jgi:hypothetical protein
MGAGSFVALVHCPEQLYDKSIAKRRFSMADRAGGFIRL